MLPAASYVFYMAFAPAYEDDHTGRDTISEAIAQSYVRTIRLRIVISLDASRSARNISSARAPSEASSITASSS